MAYDLKALFEEAFEKSDSIRLKMVGKSMYPIIKGNDKYNVIKKAPLEVREGDILVYQKRLQDKVTCYAHIVIKINEEPLYFVVSDSKGRPINEIVYPNEIIGIVVL